MVLINVVQHALFQPGLQSRLSYWKILRFKMILGYEAWHRHLKPKDFILQAILKTLIEKLTLAVAAVQQALPKDCAYRPI